MHVAGANSQQRNKYSRATRKLDSSSHAVHDSLFLDVGALSKLAVLNRVLLGFDVLDDEFVGALGVVGKCTVHPPVLMNKANSATIGDAKACNGDIIGRTISQRMRQARNEGNTSDETEDWREEQDDKTMKQKESEARTEGKEKP